MAVKIISGVYAIVHTASGRIYVGSSINLKRRKKEQLASLRHNKNRNKRLQSAWNEFGEQAFEWRLLESILDTSILRQAEQKWMDKYRSYEAQHGFNQSPNSESNLGYKMPPEVGAATSRRLRGHKPSPETCARIAAKARGNKRAKDRHLGKLTEQDVIEIKQRLARHEPELHIAQDYNVSGSTISAIASRRTWWHISLSPEIEEMVDKRPRNFNQGDNNGSAKLCERDVKAIKQRLADGESPAHIARDYPVSDTAIRKIHKGIKWAHVTI